MDETIIGLLKQPSNDGHSNLKVSEYVERMSDIKESLDLCLNVIYNHINVDDNIAKFVAVKIIDKICQKYIDIQLDVFEKILVFFKSISELKKEYPKYLIATLANTEATIFCTHFNENLHIFDPMIQLLNYQPKGVYIFLTLMDSIFDTIIVETNKLIKNAHITRLKGNLRMHQSKILEIFTQITKFYCSFDFEMTTLVLKILAKFIHWSDILISFTPSINQVLCSCLLNETCFEPTVSCYVAFMEKKMSSEQRISIITNILTIFASIDGFYTNMIYNPPMIKFLDKIGCLLVEPYLKNSGSQSFRPDSINLINHIFKISLDILVNENHENLCYICAFINKYTTMFATNKSMFDSTAGKRLMEIIMNKAQYYNEFPNSSENLTKTCWNSIIINIQRHVNPEFGHALFDALYDNIMDPKNDPLHVLSSLKLIRLLPELFSMSYFQNPSYTKKMINLITTTTTSFLILKTSHPIIHKYICNIIHAFEFNYHKDHDVYQPIFAYLFNQFTSPIDQDKHRILVVKIVLKLIQNHPEYTNCYFDPIFVYFTNYINRQISNDFEYHIGILPYETYEIIMLIYTGGYYKPEYDRIFNILYQNIQNHIKRLQLIIMPYDDTCYGANMNETQVSTCVDVLKTIIHMIKGVSKKSPRNTSFITDFLTYIDEILTYSYVRLYRSSELLGLCFNGLKRLYNHELFNCTNEICKMIQIFSYPTAETPTFLQFIVDFLYSLTPKRSCDISKIFVPYSQFISDYITYIYLSTVIQEQRQIVEIHFNIFESIRLILSMEMSSQFLIENHQCLFTIFKSVLSVIPVETDDSVINVLSRVLFIELQLINKIWSNSTCSVPMNNDLYIQFIINPSLMILFNKLRYENGFVRSNKVLNQLDKILTCLVNQGLSNIIIQQFTNLFPQFCNNNIFLYLRNLSSLQNPSIPVKTFEPLIIQFFTPPKLDTCS